MIAPQASRAYTDNYAVNCPNDIYCSQSNPGHNWIEAKTQNWGTNEKGSGYPAELCIRILITTSGSGHNWCTGAFYPVQLPGSSMGQFGVGNLKGQTGLPYPYNGYTLQYNIYGPSQIMWGWWYG